MEQLICIGEGNMLVWATYNEDDCGLLFIEKLTTQDGIDLTDYFTCDQLETMAKKLDAGHEQALRDARNRGLEDLAEERCRDREL
jgi:hypothetical protein